MESALTCAGANVQARMANEDMAIRLMSLLAAIIRAKMEIACKNGFVNFWWTTNGI